MVQRGYYIDIEFEQYTAGLEVNILNLFWLAKWIGVNQIEIIVFSCTMDLMRLVYL